MVDGAGRTGLRWAIVDFHRAWPVTRADRRVRGAVPGGSGAAPLRDDLHGHLHGHAGAQHAAIRHAAGTGPVAPSNAVRRHHAA
ncbi:hypothetical protein G6F50_017146 [Rhizopus delemar]|uniref:Uncharacterized protein n=1 Tax=Rhizopus delemar TaxID=936053 RepID=A0A9P6XR78_9FUNG|nr:hypothetical protein G6F50_017146 [Rhizopus delemar]